MSNLQQLNSNVGYVSIYLIILFTVDKRNH